jgi:hypothetical protein
VQTYTKQYAGHGEAPANLVNEAGSSLGAEEGYKYSTTDFLSRSSQVPLLMVVIARRRGFTRPTLVIYPKISNHPLCNKQKSLAYPCPP